MTRWNTLLEIVVWAIGAIVLAGGFAALNWLSSPRKDHK